MRSGTAARRAVPALLLASCAVAPGAASDPASAGARAAVLLEETRDVEGLVGLSAAAAVGGEVVFARAVGLADAEAGTPATPATTYRIASTTKALTAVAVMQLVERGRVRLEDDVREHVPDFPPKRWPVRVEHLLAHTSGIRHYGEDTANRREHFGGVQEAIALFAGEPLLFEPGTRAHYTTYGYTLLQGVIESASGAGFGEYVRRRVTGPAGMDHTGLEVAGRSYPARAAGYRRAPDGARERVPPDDLSFKYAGGGMLSTPSDLVRLCVALEQGTLLGEDATRTMLTEHRPGLALGWGIAETAGDLPRRIRHPGGALGFESALECFPDAGVAVAVLANEELADPAVVQDLALELAALFLPPPAPRAPDLPGDAP